MDNEVLYKGYIRTLNRNHNQTPTIEIIYRILNYKKIYFFAEEIITGCIFPIYGFGKSDNEERENNMNFIQYSYIQSGKYFVYVPIMEGKKVFEYEYAPKKHFAWENAKNPNPKEVNKYLKEYRKDNDWKANLIMMETYNKYFYDLPTIKKELKNSENIFTEESIQETEMPKVYTPIINIEEIDEFGYDLSTQQELCQLVGRETEKKEIIKSISIKNESVLIVGPSGSGKTSLIESLANEIKKGHNTWLQNKMIFYVNIASLIHGTKYRGEFEEKFQKLIDFCVKNKENIILFIDEIHNLYGLGRTENSSIDAMNILKTYIIKRDLTIIGATTDKEYKEYLTKDNAFENRFNKILLKAPNEKLNIEIILSYIEELEQRYSIKLNLDKRKTKEIAEYIVTITDKKHQNVVGDIPVENPKLAKNIIEDAFVEAIYNSSKEVSLNEISMAILSCSKLSPTFRKEIAEKLKNKILSSNEIKKAPLMLVKTI